MAGDSRTEKQSSENKTTVKFFYGNDQLGEPVALDIAEDSTGESSKLSKENLPDFPDGKFLGWEINGSIYDTDQLLAYEFPASSETQVKLLIEDQTETQDGSGQEQTNQSNLDNQSNSNQTANVETNNKSNMNKAQDVETVDVKFVITKDQSNVETVAKGSVLDKNLSKAPEKKYWPQDATSFDGWYTDDDTLWDFDKKIEKDMTLTAKFATGFLIKFKKGSGYSEDLVIETREYKPNTSINDTVKRDLLVPEQGYRFVGWYEESDPEQKLVTFGPSLKATKDMTFVAKYSNVHTVVYISEGTQVPGNPVQVQNGEKTENFNVTRDGYYFAGWSKKETIDSAADLFNFNTPITEDVTLYAQWTSATVRYKVVSWFEKPNIPVEKTLVKSTDDYEHYETTTYNAPAGTKIDIIKSDTSSYVGYGKNINSSGRNKINDISYGYFDGPGKTSYTVDGDGTTVVNLYFNRTVYDLKFDLQPGGNYTATMMWNDTKQVYKQNAYSSDCGYTFKAKLDMDIEGAWPSWANCNIERNSMTNSFFKEWANSPAYVSKRMTFTSDMIDISTTYATKVGESITYRANWQNSRYDSYIGYYFQVFPWEVSQINNGSLGTDSKGRERTVLQKNGKYYELNYEYSQSYIGDGLNPKKITGFKAPSNNDGLPGHKMGQEKYGYDRLSYPMDLNLMGGKMGNNYSNVDCGNVMYGDQVYRYFPAGELTKTLNGITYVFDGWYKDNNYYDPYDPVNDKMPNAPLTLYAKWKATGTKVNYYDTLQSANPVKAAEIGRGEKITEADGPYVKGVSYDEKGVFNGWYRYLGGVRIPFFYSSSVTEDTNLYADWLIDGFKVKYSYEGQNGTLPVDSSEYAYGRQTRTAEPGSDLELPSGKNFVYWDATIKGENGDQSTGLYYPNMLYSVKADTTMKAVYANTADLIKIVYNSNYPASSGLNQETTTWNVVKNSDVTLADNKFFSNYENHSILSWNTSADGSGKSYSPEEVVKMGTEDMILYAQWGHTGYDVTFTHTDGGQFEGTNPETVTFNKVAEGSLWSDAITVPTATASAQYYFSGWEVVTENTGLTGLPDSNYKINSDLEFKAVFKKKTDITLKAEDASKTYDGKALTEGGLIIEGDMANSDLSVELKMTDDSKVINVNENTVKNVIDRETVKISNSNGKDVTDQYNIITKIGDLSIKPKTVTVSSVDAQFAYDGQPHTSNAAIEEGYINGEGNIKSGYVWTGTITQVGTSPNEFSLNMDELALENGNKTNYDFVTKAGILTVNEVIGKIDRNITKPAISDQVLGEQAIPKSSGDDQVLGENATPKNSGNGSDGSVLGEESRTSDAMNMLPILVILLVLALIALVVITAKRRSRKD